MLSFLFGKVLAVILTRPSNELLLNHLMSPVTLLRCVNLFVSRMASFTQVWSTERSASVETALIMVHP